MSAEYDLYLEQHKANVAKSYYWMRENIPEILPDIPGVNYEHQICFCHDESKSMDDEYNAYDAYFYGYNGSYKVTQDFIYAWLNHIHRNLHHWQHWVLINDDPTEGVIAMNMPHEYIIEMICDWWSFSWREGKLDEIFTWYDEHEQYMNLSPKTRSIVEYILYKIKDKLEDQK